MTQLLILREHIQKMYQRYSSFFQVVMRFMVGFGLFFAINRVLGYRPILSHGYVNVIMGVISVIFPLEAMIFLVALFIVLQVMYVSKMLAFCIGVIFLILYLLYIQFIPKHGYVLIAVPLAYSVGLSAGAPVLLGLLFGPAGVLPGVIGVLLYYLFRNLITVASSATTDSFDLFQVLIDQLVEDEELFAAIAVFVVVMLVVYMIRSLRVDFSFEAAIIIGIVSDIILCLGPHFPDCRSNRCAAGLRDHTGSRSAASQSRRRCREHCRRTDYRGRGSCLRTDQHPHAHRHRHCRYCRLRRARSGTEHHPAAAGVSADCRILGAVRHQSAGSSRVVQSLCRRKLRLPDHSPHCPAVQKGLSGYPDAGQLPQDAVRQFHRGGIP